MPKLLVLVKNWLNCQEKASSFLQNLLSQFFKLVLDQFCDYSLKKGTPDTVLDEVSNFYSHLCFQDTVLHNNILYLGDCKWHSYQELFCST